MIAKDPYVPLAQAQPTVAAIQADGNFNDDEMDLIRYENALEIFPRISQALKLTLKKNPIITRQLLRIRTAIIPK